MTRNKNVKNRPRDEKSENILSETSFKTVDYLGRRVGQRCIVIRIDDREARPLPLRTDLQVHDSNGFDWRTSRAGSCQLSLALLADAVNENVAVNYCKEFSEKVIGKLPFDIWKLSNKEIAAMAEDILKVNS